MKYRIMKMEKKGEVRKKYRVETSKESENKSRR